MKIDKQCIAGKALTLNDKGEILLIQQCAEAEVDGANAYHLPGGAVNFGEKIEDALTREIKEEIGVDSEVVDLVDVKHWVANIRGEIIQIFGVYYTCKVESDAFTLEKAEIQSHVWVNEDNIDNYNVLEPSLSVIKTML